MYGYDSYKLATPWDEEPDTATTIIDIKVSTDQQGFDKWADEEPRDVTRHEWDTDEGWVEFRVSIERECYLDDDPFERTYSISGEDVESVACEYVGGVGDENAEWEVEDYSKRPKPRKRWCR